MNLKPLCVSKQLTVNNGEKCCDWLLQRPHSLHICELRHLNKVFYITYCDTTLYTFSLSTETGLRPLQAVFLKLSFVFTNEFLATTNTPRNTHGRWVSSGGGERLS